MIFVKRAPFNTNIYKICGAQVFYYRKNSTLQQSAGFKISRKNAKNKFFANFSQQRLFGKLLWRNLLQGRLLLLLQNVTANGFFWLLRWIKRPFAQLHLNIENLRPGACFIKLSGSVSQQIRLFARDHKHQLAAENGQISLQVFTKCDHEPLFNTCNNKIIIF